MRKQFCIHNGLGFSRTGVRRGKEAGGWDPMWGNQYLKGVCSIEILADKKTRKQKNLMSKVQNKYTFFFSLRI